MKNLVMVETNTTLYNNYPPIKKIFFNVNITLEM